MANDKLPESLFGNELQATELYSFCSQQRLIIFVKMGVHKIIAKQTQCRDSKQHHRNAAIAAWGGLTSVHKRIFSHFSVCQQEAQPFKVTDFGTNRKPVCDFLLGITLNYILSPTVSRHLQIIGQICTFDRGRYL